MHPRDNSTVRLDLVLALLVNALKAFLFENGTMKQPPFLFLPNALVAMQ